MSDQNKEDSKTSPPEPTRPLLLVASVVQLLGSFYLAFAGTMATEMSYSLAIGIWLLATLGIVSAVSLRRGVRWAWNVSFYGNLVVVLGAIGMAFAVEDIRWLSFLHALPSLAILSALARLVPNVTCPLRSQT